MGLNLSKSIKKNPLTYIKIKAKFNPKKISKYTKAFEAISGLNLIDFKKYLEVHTDCEDLHPVAHYLFYGYKDTDKSYINPLFDENYYKLNYLEESSEDPLMDYVLNGFYKGYQINPNDKDFVLTLDESLDSQYFENGSYLTCQEVVAKYLVQNKPLKTKEIKIAVFLNDPFYDFAPCPYIRIHSLFKDLSQDNNFKFFIYGAESYNMIDTDDMLNCKLFDVVIVQRILPFLDTLQFKCLDNNIKIIYETDDDLLGVEENSPSYEYVNNVRNELSNFIDASDVVTVSTPNLALKFSNAQVIRNYYVSDVYNIKNEIARNSKLKLGYFGTLTHSKDLALIKNVVLKLKEKYDFDFEVIGGFNDGDKSSDEDWYTPVELPPNNMNFEVFMSWLEDNASWDIGIVPLEDSEFNRGKSELKFIEMAVLHVPSVFSDMSVYNSVVVDGVSGFLASTEEEWISKIELLINDVKLREEISQNALETVLTNYLKKSRVNQWKNLILNLIR